MSERMNFLLKYQRKHFGLLSVVLLLVVEWFLHAVCLTSILRASRDLPVHQLRSPGQNSRFYEFIKTDSANELFISFSRSYNVLERRSKIFSGNKEWMNQSTRAFKVIKDCYNPIVTCLFNEKIETLLMINRIILLAFNICFIREMFLSVIFKKRKIELTMEFKFVDENERTDQSRRDKSFNL